MRAPSFSTLSTWDSPLLIIPTIPNNYSNYSYIQVFRHDVELEGSKLRLMILKVLNEFLNHIFKISVSLFADACREFSELCSLHLNMFSRFLHCFCFLMVFDLLLKLIYTLIQMCVLVFDPLIMSYFSIKLEFLQWEVLRTWTRNDCI